MEFNEKKENNNDSTSPFQSSQSNESKASVYYPYQKQEQESSTSGSSTSSSPYGTPSSPPNPSPYQPSTPSIPSPSGSPSTTSSDEKPAYLYGTQNKPVDTTPSPTPPAPMVNEARRVNEVDEELEALLAQQRAKIKVVGTGGGGNNTINRIFEVGVRGAETISVNTDAQDLLYSNSDKKILIGKEATRGLGAGSMPKMGEEAARENETEIKDALKDADMVFITCGLGGGTGTGSAPVIAEVAKKLGALTVGVVTIPFAMEGQRRYENAVIGLEKMENIVDTLIVIPNDKLLELAPDLPLPTAFKVADEILTNAVKGIAELVTKAGLVNLDFADIRTVMGNGGVALIGVGESDTENRATEAVDKAISNPLLDVDITGANGALINVTGGSDLTLEEARKVVETISEKLDEDAKIIWGAQVNDDLQGTLRTLLIITGVKSTQIFGPERKISTRRKKEIETELGIEFVD
jgi:cell division protein FtsZ